MSAENGIILSLDKVTCSILFCGGSRQEKYTEEKKRTLRLVRLKDQSRDQCLLEIWDKRMKMLHSQVVTFCGMQNDTQTIQLKKKLKIQFRITLIFTDVSVLIFNAELKENEMLCAYCAERCQYAFAYVTTVCVSLQTYPPAWSCLKNTNQVLIGLTRYKFTLIGAKRHHVCVVSWPIDQTYPEKSGDILQIAVAGEGSFKFTTKHDQSKLSIIYTSMLEIRERQDTYDQVDDQIARSANKMDNLYLMPIESLPLCELCKSLYLSCGVAGTSKTAGQGNTYDIDLNEYVEMNRVWYEKLIGSLGDVGDRYITTCTYKGNTVRRLGKGRNKTSTSYGEYLTTTQEERHSEEDRERKYLTLIDPKPKTSTSYGEYLTTTQEKSKTSTSYGEYLTTTQEERHSEEDRERKYLTLIDPKPSPSTSDGEHVSPARDERKEGETASRRDPPKNRHTMPCETHEHQSEGQNPGLRTCFSDPGQYTGNIFEINKTLKDALYGKPLPKDTLRLSHSVRFDVCIRLYMRSCLNLGTTAEDWQIVGEKIGLTAEAINLISVIVKNHSLPYPAAELVLRHWQFVYNKCGVTDTCPYPCTKESLIKILDEIERADLIELIQNDGRTECRK